MAKIVPNEGKVAIQKVIYDNLPTLYLRLFKSNYTPGDNTTLADLEAIEADFSGYLAVDLDGSSFPDPGLAAAKAKVIADNWAQFSHNGGGTDNDVYGWWIDDGTKVWAAEVWDTPVTMDPDALPIALKVVDTLDSEV